ncbi:unnamed protein product [Caenorhabditis sp. 36 PRJEB53466]|nr:unnamed protein product [Caenorhabditis sp. 36 PRJEB53466]
MDEEEAPMSLVEDHYDDMTIEDGPLEDASYYNEEEFQQCEEEDVQPTSDNFSLQNRYKPSIHTPKALDTIHEENDLRSNNSSRAPTRTSNTNLRMNHSDNSHDISGQFQFGNGANAIEQFTDNFYAKENKAERLFPEHLQTNFASPPMDKQNSWEPSVIHYEKQPTPEVLTGSPGMVFGHLSRNGNPKRAEEKVNDENVPTGSRISPERSILTTSPLNSSKYFETKTSTPKRPGASNRLGQRLQPPALEISSIYALSPQRVNGTATVNPNQSRFFGGMRANQTQADNTTMVPNQTVNLSMINRILKAPSGGGGRGTIRTDEELVAQLERVRTKRANEENARRPDFRINTTANRTQSTRTTDLPSACTSSQSDAPPIFPSSSRNRTNTTVNNSTRFSTKSSSTMMMTAGSHDDLSSSTTVRTLKSRGSTTVIPNPSSSSSTATTIICRDGRDSVNSMRTMSRASTAMSSAAGANPTRPLTFSAKRLAFGTVAKGENLTMELEYTNVSDRQLHVRTALDSSNRAFQILDNKTIAVEPGRSGRVRVDFTPYAIGRFQVFMQVDVPAQNWRQAIPVWGIGGTAKIAFVTSGQDVQSTGKPSEFTMLTSNLSRISFKLNNIGQREGFALISVFDSQMRPLNSPVLLPSRGILLRPGHEKRIEIRVDLNVLLQDQHPDDIRTSSAMSTASTSSVMTVRRRAPSSEADLIVQIAWGDEIIRQRLKMLEKNSGRRESIDGLDFTSFPFADEKCSAPTDSPLILPEDSALFASSYRTQHLFIFSHQRAFAAFRAASGSHQTCGGADNTILETTAFRHHTFIRDKDATMVPMINK